MGVSIIIPAYNSEKYLAATIQSVLDQTRQDWELVVVNDGSTDQTGAIAETFAHRDKRIQVVHQENAGVAAARNRGFAESKPDYEYVMFFDSDDVLEPDALEILIQALEKDHDAVAAHGLLRTVGSEGKPLAIDGGHIWPGRRRGIQGHRLRLWPVSAPTTFAVLAYANCIPTGAIIIRRAQLEMAGGFEPNLKLAQDWDVWLRVSRLGHIAFVNKVVLARRLHAGNRSKNRQLAQDCRLYVRKKMYRSVDLNEHEKRIILNGYRYHKLYDARISLANAARKLSKRKYIDALKNLQEAMYHILGSIKGNL